MSRRPDTSSARALLVFAAIVGLAAVLMLGVGCNRVDAGPDKETGAAPSPAGPPAGSDLSSLGPDADTRIYYQYIDERGGVRFAERLDDVPESWRDKVGYLELDSPPPMSPAEAKRVRDDRYAKANPSSARTGSASSGTGEASSGQQSEVLLYYADWCGYCVKAKRHLDRAGVDYTLRDVDNPHIKRELLEKTGQKGIPVIEVNGRIMKGYSASSLDALLDSL